MRKTLLFFRPLFTWNSMNPQYYRALCLTVVFVLFAVARIFAQANIKVSGTVKDGKGETLPGVSVRLKGATSGTLTDAQGHYTIQADAAGTLTFTDVGTAN
jgi:hypothetical protein